MTVRSMEEVLDKFLLAMCSSDIDGNSLNIFIKTAVALGHL
jgi:hypothetical protein